MVAIVIVNRTFWGHFSQISLYYSLLAENLGLKAVCTPFYHPPLSHLLSIGHELAFQVVQIFRTLQTR